MYGMFSKAWHDDQYLGKDNLLKNPNNILDDPVKAFASALWLYMTPQFPKPSAHNVITGFFHPNENDQEWNLGRDFGTTIAILAKDKAGWTGTTRECWTTEDEQESDQA